MPRSVHRLQRVVRPLLARGTALVPSEGFICGIPIAAPDAKIATGRVHRDGRPPLAHLRALFPVGGPSIGPGAETPSWSCSKAPTAELRSPST